MLTADLVRARRQGSRLTISQLAGKSRARAHALATVYLELAREQVGSSHEQLEQAWDSVEVGPREKKLADGLRKLIEDECEFEATAAVEPRELRGRVFLLATELRRERGREFDRREVFQRLSDSYGAEPESLDQSLYADLRSQQRLTRVAEALSADALVERYDAAQVQAVLLRAVRVVAHVRCQDPSRYRALFRALKFRRLLYRIERESDGYRIEIDGPFSLFDSVTKYGLQLALLFPVLCQSDELRLRADLRWGQTRTPLQFEFDHVERRAKALAPESFVSDEIRDLVKALERLDGGWTITLNDAILELPGIGLCVPDLCFCRGGQKVYFELLGFWSRETVWKRVELVEQGLGARVLFGVSSRLRVSEAALGDEQPSALYVYKGALSARAILEKVERLAIAPGSG